MSNPMEPSVSTKTAPKPRTSNWKGTTLRNTAERTAREAPLHPRAFRTYQQDPNATAAMRRRYSSQRQDKRLVREHGGKRHNMLRWGSLLLRGVCEDDIEIVEDALAMPLARSGETVQGGLHGAAYNFGGDAVVTLARVAREHDLTIKGARDLAAAIPRYYSEPEWGNIEAHLREISTYFPPGAALFDEVTLGDSALHIAVRQGSMKAARRLMLRGFDPLVVNADGHTVARVLGYRYNIFAEDLRAHIERRDDMSLRYAHVEAEDYETQRRAAEERKAAREALLAKRDDIHDVASAVCTVLEDRDALVLEPLAQSAWRCDIEGVEMSRKDAAMLATRPSLIEELAMARQILEDTTPEFGRGRARNTATVRRLFRSSDPDKAKTRKAFRDPKGENAARAYTSEVSGARDFLGDGETRVSRGTVSGSIAFLSANALSGFDRAHGKSKAPPSLSSLSAGFFDDVNVADWAADLDHAAVLIQCTWRAIASRMHLVLAVLNVSAAKIQALARGADLRRTFDVRPLVKRHTVTVYPGQVGRELGRRRRSSASRRR